MSTAGYSGTPLPRKLGIAPGARVALLSAPPGMHDRVAPLPDRVRVVTRASGVLDVAVLFVDRRVDLERRFASVAARMAPAGGLWVAWPKRASGVATDLTEDVVRAVGLGAGLVDNKVCAVDATWSALRFVIRVADRPGRTVPPPPAPRSSSG